MKDAGAIYCRGPERTLLEMMAKRECRSFVDQLALVIREAAKRRRITLDDEQDGQPRETATALAQ